MKDFLTKLISSYTLEADQYYELYVLQYDSMWDWCYIGSYDILDTEKLVIDYVDWMSNADTAGLWLSISSGDGTIDHTVIKWQNRRGNEPLERRVFREEYEDYVGKHERKTAEERRQ